MFQKLKTWLVFKIIRNDDDILYEVEQFICEECQGSEMKGM